LQRQCCQCQIGPALPDEDLRPLRVRPCQGAVPLLVSAVSTHAVGRARAKADAAAIVAQWTQQIWQSRDHACSGRGGAHHASSCGRRRIPLAM
jgi:hypothetical protein